MAGFEDLDVWKRSVDLSSQVYREMRPCADFGFRDQITRSCLSIASNIAEGMERGTTPDKMKFLDYARSSSGEFRTQVIVGQNAGLIPESIAETWVMESREISAMIQGLARSIRSAL